MNLFPVGPENRAVTNGMAEMALQIARMQAEIRQLQEALGAQEQAPREVAGTQEQAPQEGAGTQGQAPPERASTQEPAPQEAVAPEAIELPAQGTGLFRLRPLPCPPQEARPRRRSQVVLGAPFIDQEPLRAPTLVVTETEAPTLGVMETEAPTLGIMETEAPQAEHRDCGCAIVRGWGRL